MTAVEERRTAFEDNDGSPVGYGRMLRKEDQRFIRGRGRYIDDVQLRGHAAPGRSCARRSPTPAWCRSTPARPRRCPGCGWWSPARCSPSRTWPGCRRCPTTCRPCWPPTRSASRARRWPSSSPRTATAPATRSSSSTSSTSSCRRSSTSAGRWSRTRRSSATIIEGKTDNHCFDWETGDAAATDAVFADAEVVVTQDIVYPRVHPAPMETCGAVADYDAIDGKLTLYTTTQAPHAHRTLYAMVAGLPEHKIRILAGDIGGGFGNKVPIYPGLRLRDRRLAAHRQAGQVGRGPLGEPAQHRLRPRLRHARRDRRLPGRQDPGHPHPRARRPRRLQRHGGPGEVPGRLLRRVHRQLRPGGRALLDDRGLHQQGARRGGLRLLVPDHRGGLPGRAAGRVPGRRAGDRPGGAADQELHPARPVPLRDQDRLGLRLGQLRAHDARGDAHRRLRASCGGSRPRSGNAAS